MNNIVRSAEEWYRLRQELRLRLKPWTDWLEQVMLCQTTIYYIKTESGFERIPSQQETYVLDKIKEERDAFFTKHNIPAQ